MEIEEQIAQGDFVATRWTHTGTHDGDLMGIAPTGNRVTQPGIDISRVSDGKVVETWEGSPTCCQAWAMGWRMRWTPHWADGLV
jgi:predicted ester cyclase